MKLHPVITVGEEVMRVKNLNPLAVSRNLGDGEWSEPVTLEVVDSYNFAQVFRHVIPGPFAPSKKRKRRGDKRRKARARR